MMIRLRLLAATLSLAALFATPAHALKISELTAFSGPVADTDELILNDYSATPATRRADASQLKAYFADGSIPTGTIFGPADLDLTDDYTWTGTHSFGVLSATAGIFTGGVTADTMAADTLDLNALDFAGTTDTTLTRSAPGVLAIEGVDVLTTATGYTQAAANAAFATAAQGALADTATQPGDAVSTLTNDAAYLDAAAAGALYEPLGVAAADITDATATGQSLITAETPFAAAQASGAAGQSGQPAHITQAAKVWRKLSNMRLEPMGLDQNGLIPDDDSKQLVWLNVGDSIGARAFDLAMASMIRTYSPDIPFYRNGRNATMVSGSTVYNGHFVPAHIFGVTDGGTINEKNNATADYAGSFTGSTVDLDATDTISFFGKPGRYSGAGAYDSPVLVPATTVKVFYERSSGAGTFDIEVSSTSTSSGFTKQGDTVDAANATTDIAVAERTLAAGEYAGRIVCQSGSVKIIGWALYRTDIPQIVVYHSATGSLSPLEWATPSTDQIEGLLSAINPDVITWAYNNSAEDNEVAFDVLNSALSAQSLDPALVHFSNVSTVSADAGMIDPRHDMAISKGFTSYSARYAFGTDDEIIRAGLEGDGVHLAGEAYEYFSNELMDILGWPAAVYSASEQIEMSEDGLARTTPIGSRASRAWTYKDEEIFRLGESIYLSGVSERLGSLPNLGGLWLNRLAAGNDIVEMDAAPWNTTSDFSIVAILDHDDAASAAGTAAILAWDSAVGGTTSFPKGATSISALWVYRDAGSARWEIGLNPGDDSTNGKIWQWDDESDGEKTLVFTYDQSTGEMLLYINGALQELVSGSANSIDWSNNTLNPPVLGSDSNAHSVRELSAKFYGFGMTQSVLTSTQIAEIYTAPEKMAEYCEEVSYFFDERSGTRVYDHSGSDNNASLINGPEWVNPLRQPALNATGTATLDYASIAADASEALTITVTGAATGDTVILQPQQIAGVSLYGHVSAAATVTVTAINHSAGAIDPASTSVRATVIKP